MGYSVSIKFKNEEQLNKVNDFLTQHQNLLDSLPDAEGLRPQYFMTIFQRGDDISYAPNRNRNLHLGLDFTTTPYYSWSLCALLAYKFNLKDSKGIHVLYYDSEKIKIDVVSEYKKSSNIQIYENSGLPVLIKQEIQPELKDAKEYIAYIEEEYNNKLKVVEVLKVISDKIDIFINNQPTKKTAKKI